VIPVTPLASLFQVWVTVSVVAAVAAPDASSVRVPALGTTQDSVRVVMTQSAAAPAATVAT